LHGGVARVEIWLIPGIDIVDIDPAVSVVLEVLDDLIGVSLAPISGLAGRIGDSAEVAAVVVGA